MSMHVKPLKEGGQRISGETTRCDYRIDVIRDYDGLIYGEDGEQVGDMQFTIKTPELNLTDEQKAMLKARHDACAECPAAEDLVDTTVRCRQCRPCKSVKNLLSPGHTCPEGRWPTTGD